MAAFSQLTPGELFARDFRVLRPLAEGGMGAVYRVEQVSTGRERALKIMHPQFARDEETRARFTLEARIGARLQSEHVVEVVSAGVDEPTGMPWMVMELLEGAELSKVVQGRGRLTPSEVLEVFRQLTHGLGEAHRTGLVHRDIKPENVFLASSHRSGGLAMVKILDFGVAKLVQEHSGEDAGTRAVGTPKWMAPEQSESGGNIIAATDVWPLGLMAFYMLTGRVYWRTAASNNTNLTVLMREMLFEPIIDPAKRAAELSAPELPQGFAEWFARCVVRDIGARFANATEAFQALEPLLLAAGAQPGPAALTGVAETLRSLQDATPSSHTGPARTPPPSGPADSGDGATIYPARPATPGASSPPAPAVSAPLAGTSPPIPLGATSTPGAAPATKGPPVVAIGIALAVVLAVAGAYALHGSPPASVPLPVVPLTPPIPVVVPPRPPVPVVPRSFLMTIDSQPPGAAVVEGGKSLGTTPMELTIDDASIASGPRTLMITHPGFLPYTLSQGASAEPVHRSVTLVAEPEAAPTDTHVKEGSHGGHKAKPTTAPEPPPPADPPPPTQPQIRMNR